jgi:hypothetical protein
MSRIEVRPSHHPCDLSDLLLALMMMALSFPVLIMDVLHSLGLGEAVVSILGGVIEIIIARQVLVLGILTACHLFLPLHDIDDVSLL